MEVGLCELSEACNTEARYFDGKGRVDIPGEGEAEFFQGIYLPDDFGSEIRFGTGPGRSDQVGNDIFPNAHQLASQVGGLGRLILVSFFLLFWVVLGVQSIPSREEKGLKEGGTAVGSEGCGFRGFGPEAGKVVDAMDRAWILVGKNREGEATGADGRKELFGSVGGENQEGMIGRFLQCFEESVCRFGRGKTHPFCFEDQSDFERGSVRFAGEGVFQLADLGD